MPAPHADSEPRAESCPGTLSIVIPAYNEAPGIIACIETVAAHLERTGRAAELIVVDDGSIDETSDRARQTFDAARAGGSVTGRVIRHDSNRGKGAAVRTGLAAATGDPMLICDADLSTPLDELPRLERWLVDGYDVAIGSRDLPDAHLDPPQPLHRRWLAWSFRGLRRRMLLPEIRDTQCGFKLLTRRAVLAILPDLQLDGWLYDCELLSLAAQKGLRIREVGVTWRDRRESRVRLLRDLPATLRELLALRRRFRRDRLSLIMPHSNWER